MKKYEKESFFKAFFLFFLTLILLNSAILYFYYNEQKNNLHDEIFNKLRLYNYTFEGENIRVDVIGDFNPDKHYSLFIENGEIYSLFDIPSSQKNSLKVIYDYDIYEDNLSKVFLDALMKFLLSSFILLLLSLFYSWYALKPIKNALHLLDEFLKDLIHDLNTPVTSIMLNLKILKNSYKQSAIERIWYSTKNISTLYSNLEALIKEQTMKLENINVENLIREKIEYYSYLYPHIHFELLPHSSHLLSSKNEFSRIIDNLISNACKYNKKDGQVTITLHEKKIVIEDTGIGINNIDKVFERYYKENDRGLGLGLHIVKKLCKKLDMDINIKSEPNKGTLIELTLK